MNAFVGRHPGTVYRGCGSSSHHASAPDGCAVFVFALNTGAFVMLGATEGAPRACDCVEPDELAPRREAVWRGGAMLWDIFGHGRFHFQLNPPMTIEAQIE